MLPAVAAATFLCLRLRRCTGYRPRRCRETWTGEDRPTGHPPADDGEAGVVSAPWCVVRPHTRARPHLSRVGPRGRETRHSQPGLLGVVVAQEGGHLRQ